MIQRDGFQRGFSMGLGFVLLAILLYFGWELLKAVLAIGGPFVAAIIVSLLLDPLVVRIQERFTGNDRNRAVAVVFGLFLVVFLGLIAFLVPTLISQTSRLVGFFTPVSYTVEKAPAVGGFYEVVAKDLTTPSYTITGLTNDRGYQFRVIATDATGKAHILPGVAETPRALPKEVTASVSPAPSPTPTPIATPDTSGSPELSGVSGATPQPVTSPTPEPSPPSPIALPASPTPSASEKIEGEGDKKRDAGKDAKAEDSNSALDVPYNLEPGQMAAIPGNASIRLYWKPPVEIQSGFERLRDNINIWLKSNKQILGMQLPSNLDSLQEQYAGQISQALQNTITRFGNVLLGSVSKLLTVVLVPIATLYILLDMSRLRARFLYVLPDRVRKHFLRVANDIGGAFGGYLRGMFTLSSLYALGATIAYFLCGMQAYALLLGFVAGLLYSVPFVGPAITLFLVGTVSLATQHTVLQTVMAIVLSIVLNFAFDNFLTPRIIGDKVGLHPLTTMFSLFLGGQIFGFLGMIFAVPLAASIQASLQRIFPRLSDPIPLSILLEEDKQRAENREEEKEEKEGGPPGEKEGSGEKTPGTTSTTDAEDAAKAEVRSVTSPATNSPEASPYAMSGEPDTKS